MKKYFVSLLALFMCGCFTQQPLLKEKSENNQTYTVAYLFEHDGCKVYRFYDRGHYVYFTNCNGETIAKKDSSEIRNSTRLKQ